MKKLSKLLILFFAPVLLQAQSDCGHGEAYTELDFNNIKAGLMQSGALWWDGSDGRYAAKAEEGEPEVQAIFAAGLWLGGEHPDGSIRVATTIYGHGGSDNEDYFPGPIHEALGTVLPEDCTNWDKHFKILKSEINSHLIDFANDNEIDVIDSVIYSWPGKDNPHFFDFNGYNLPSGQDLAPFVDTNGDDIYNPSDGDYPDIKGDQAIWWVFNDIANVHTSSYGQPINIEVQAMAYAYQNFEPTINNTTFYDFKLKYYGEETLENFQTAIWADIDLGCFTDDFIGIDTTKNMAYYYNADFVDGEVFDECGAIETYGMEIPMLGIKLLEDSENLGVTSFVFFSNNAQGTPPPGQSDPNGLLQYQNYMSGLWQDGSPMRDTGNGYYPQLGDTTTFAFHGNPSIESEWSMCSASMSNNPELDRKTLMSSGGTPLKPGDIRELSYAVIFVPDVPHPCPDLTDICAAADIVQEFEGITSSISLIEESNELNILVSPNPSTVQFTISTVLNTSLISKIEIRDIAGKLLRKENNIKSNSYTFNRNDLPAGIYFVKVINGAGRIGVEKIVFQ